MPDVWQTTSGGNGVSLTGLDDVARELWEQAGERRVWLFSGDLGSGKTTLIKSVGRLLGVTQTMGSPTFSLVNEYLAANGRKIYHVDLYRLKDEKEVVDIGMEEYLDSPDWCMVEWPEKLGRLAPEHTLNIRITTVDDLHRKIEYQAT